MNKSIISIKMNRINSLPTVDSISSLSLLINRIKEGGGSNIEFKRIVVLHDSYLIERNKLEGIENYMSDIRKQENTESEIVYSENLKSYILNLIGDTDEIFIVSSFSDVLDQINTMEVIYDLLGNYPIKVFNTLLEQNSNDFSFCHTNINKFLNYITEK